MKHPCNKLVLILTFCLWFICWGQGGARIEGNNTLFNGADGLSPALKLVASETTTVGPDSRVSTPGLLQEYYEVWQVPSEPNQANKRRLYIDVAEFDTREHLLEHLDNGNWSQALAFDGWLTPPWSAMRKDG